MTYYTVFVIDLASRRVQIVGSTPYPNDLFMRQVARGGMSGAQEPRHARTDRLSPRRADTVSGAKCNAHAERFVRLIKEECLNGVVILGEAHLRRTLTEFVDHYHQERNHQGIHDRLIAPERLAPPGMNGNVSRRARLGGLLHYYDRAA